jgi:hypothetical protein
MESTMSDSSNTTNTNDTNLLISDYSEKSFVVYGNTKPYKESLKNMGGRFNKYLKIDDEKVPGWIFSMKNKEEVANFVLGVNSGEIMESSTQLPSASNDLPTVSKPRNTSSASFQWVKYKIFRPRESQKAQLTTEEKNGNKTTRSSIEGQVIKIESHNDIVDTVYIQFEGHESPSLGVICRGKWQIFGYFKDHSIYFMDN